MLSLDVSSLQSPNIIATIVLKIVHIFSNSSIYFFKFYTKLAHFYMEISKLISSCLTFLLSSIINVVFTHFLLYNLNCFIFASQIIL
jgi:hypothetical protein